MIRSQRAGTMRSGGLSVNVFTDDELDDIHSATLEVLERTGVFVEDDEALDIFADGGCRVDRETRMVRIPPHVVEEAIRWAPTKVVLCGRTPDKDVVLEAGASPSPTSTRASRSSTPTPASCARRPWRTSPTSPGWSTPSTTSRSTRSR